MVASLVESLRWTVIIPLPVIMELDGLINNPTPLGQTAQAAMQYITSIIRTHSTSLKVQTSKGNYLTTLNIRTEEVNFSSGNVERSMDDLILKAAIWQDEHWADRSSILGVTGQNVNGAVKVVLLSLDRNCTCSLSAGFITCVNGLGFLSSAPQGTVPPAPRSGGEGSGCSPDQPKMRSEDLNFYPPVLI